LIRQIKGISWRIQGIPFVILFAGPAFKLWFSTSQNFGKMNRIKPKKRRLLGELKRNRRLTLNLTAGEYERLGEKAKEAGVAMAVYVRRVSLDGNVIARMGQEDRELFRGVVKVSNVLDGLYKLAQTEGVEHVMATCVSARDVVDRLINKLKV
jgi:hypothetical protein